MTISTPSREGDQRAPEASTARKPLTKRAVDAARYTGNGRTQHILWDGELRGFGLRVQPTGRKSWILFYRTLAGTKRLLTLGHYPGLTPDQARGEALQNLAQVAKGRDPANERQRGRAAASFKALAEAFLEIHSKTKKSHRDDARYVKKMLLPAFGTRKAETILRADLSALHRRIGVKAPYSANRMLACASKLFAWGVNESYLPAGHPNPTHGIKKFREEKRERWVTPEEMPKLAAALRAEPNIYARAAIWMYLLLGARKSEMLCARWADVDLTRGVWRLPDPKQGRPHYLPLAPPAIAILRDLPREAGNPYVFPGQSTGAHLVNVSKPWERIRTAAGCEDVRLHDLRRTVGSWLAQGGASLPLIGKVLGHTQSSTTAIYARLADEAPRRVLEQHAEAVLAAAAAEPAE